MSPRGSPSSGNKPPQHKSGGKPAAQGRLADSHGSRSAGSDVSGASGSSNSADFEDGASSEVVVQSGEVVNLPPFTSKLEKPMMEMVAGSNVWYQAHVLKSTPAKLRVLFPATSRSGADRKEWVLRTSSRIWRGSMGSRDWKYLSRGAWAPKTGGSKSRKNRSGGKRSRLGTSNAGTASASGATPEDGAASEATAGRRFPGEEPDVASPRKRLRPSPNDQGAHIQDAGSGSDQAEPGRSGKDRHMPAGPSHSSEAPASGGRRGGGGGGGSVRGGGGGSGAAKNDWSRKEASAQLRQNGGAQNAAPRWQPAQPDPLAAWFSHHFALLDRAGQLGDSGNGGTPESGFLPPKRSAAAAADPPQQQNRKSSSPSLPASSTGKGRPSAAQRQPSGLKHGSGVQPNDRSSPAAGTKPKQEGGSAQKSSQPKPQHPNPLQPKPQQPAKPKTEKSAAAAEGSHSGGSAAKQSPSKLRQASAKERPQSARPAAQAAPRPSGKQHEGAARSATAAQSNEQQREHQQQQQKATHLQKPQQRQQLKEPKQRHSQQSGGSNANLQRAPQHNGHRPGGSMHSSKAGGS